MKYARLVLIMSLLAAGLAACAREPEVIAVYPSSQHSYSAQASSAYVIREAQIEMDVDDVDAAEEEIVKYAQEQRGYITGTLSYWTDGRKFSRVSLEVPATRYERFRDDLDRVGEVTGEFLSTSSLYSPGYGWEEYTRVSIQLSPDGRARFSLPGGWKALRTLESAFSVFVKISGFLIDVLIWIAVVAGPFVLIGWLIVGIVRRLAPRYRK